MDGDCLGKGAASAIVKRPPRRDRRTWVTDYDWSGDSVFFLGRLARATGSMATPIC